MNDAAATADTAQDATMQSVADAMRDASKTAAEHAAKVRNTIGDAGPRAMRSVSRFGYTSAYVFSYGVVYAAVFVAQALPQENAIMHGLRDGGRAALDGLRKT
jgi:hypothetical protein